jgi:hypothetical protein
MSSKPPNPPPTPALIINPLLLFSITVSAREVVEVGLSDTKVDVAVFVTVVADLIVEVVEDEIRVVGTADEDGGRPVKAPTVAPGKVNTAVDVLQQRCLSACDSQQYAASFA